MIDPRGQALIAAMTYAHEHGINPAPSFDMVGATDLECGTCGAMAMEGVGDE